MVFRKGGIRKVKKVYPLIRVIQMTPPTLVTLTRPEEFRRVVQELTGASSSSINPAGVALQDASARDLHHGLNYSNTVDEPHQGLMNIDADQSLRNVLEEEEEEEEQEEEEEEEGEEEDAAEEEEESATCAPAQPLMTTSQLSVELYFDELIDQFAAAPLNELAPSSGSGTSLKSLPPPLLPAPYQPINQRNDHYRHQYAHSVHAELPWDSNPLPWELLDASSSSLSNYMGEYPLAV